MYQQPQNPQYPPNQPQWQQPPMYNPQQPYYPPPPYQQQPMMPPQYQQPYPPQMVQVNVQQHGPGCLVRGLWYIFIGCWLGFLWLNIGYFFVLTIIGLPLGLVMLNRLPWVLTLKQPDQGVQVNVMPGITQINIGGMQQYNMLVRSIYFLLVGWWAGYLWACLGYALCLLIVTLPLGLVMLNRLPMVLTLRRG